MTEMDVMFVVYETSKTGRVGSFDINLTFLHGSLGDQ